METPKEGDILEAIISSGTGQGWHYEQDTIKDKEYKCLEIYQCNGETCVVIDADSGSRLGMGFNGYFRIKRKANYINETRKIKIELTVKLDLPEEKYNEKQFQKIIHTAINSLWKENYKEYKFISGKVLKENI